MYHHSVTFTFILKTISYSYMLLLSTSSSFSFIIHHHTSHNVTPRNHFTPTRIYRSPTTNLQS